ncbi:hypothetical protein KFZ76_13765 [Methylovulum psychrotolerans]|uniref:hypothetical protein n=1 Tax=Methylovulum psychrotolerans TaxID=1704499 RepID=UPI001BFFA202|nr:hypothetical protein [Methylovulum psychrotolerans]MBT9098772.1 hypothetical protein [Methylovulum psychrotolerans]
MKEDTVTTAFVKAEKAYAAVNTLNVTYQKPPPKRTEINNPLTKEQRKQLNELITEWVTTSNLAKKPIAFDKAWSNLFYYGLSGAVNNINQIEQEEFATCKSYINQRIMIIESDCKTGLTRFKEGWRNKHIGKIHAVCKKQKISDEKRKVFMLDKWGKDSLTELTDDELRECYQYAVSSNPSWIASKYEIQGTQEQREKALGLLLNELEAQAKAVNSIFDRNNITLGKSVILSMLSQRDRTLFSDGDGNPIAETTFNRFLTKAKMCKFKAGRKIG